MRGSVELLLDYYLNLDSLLRYNVVFCTSNELFDKSTANVSFTRFHTHRVAVISLV